MRQSVVALAGGVLSMIAAGATFALMTISFGDVAARTFAHALSGAYEITEMLVGIAVFAALPIATWRSKHVTVGFLEPVLQRAPVISLAVKVLARGIVAAICLFLGYHLWLLGNQMWSRNAQAVFAGLPLAPMAWFSAAMCLLSAVAEVLRPTTQIAGEEF